MKKPEHVEVNFKNDLQPDRTTVLISIHHSHKDEPPATAQCNYDYKCQKADQMYARRLNIVDEQELHFGWVTDPAWIIIINKSKEGTLVVNNTFEVLPGQHFDGRLLPSSKITVKPLVVDTSVDIMLHVTPR